MGSGLDIALPGVSHINHVKKSIVRMQKIKYHLTCISCYSAGVLCKQVHSYYQVCIKGSCHLCLSSQNLYCVQISSVKQPFIEERRDCTNEAVQHKWGPKAMCSGGIAGETGSLFEMLSSSPNFLDQHKKGCARANCRQLRLQP